MADTPVAWRRLTLRDDLRQSKRLDGKSSARHNQLLCLRVGIARAAVTADEAVPHDSSFYV